MVWVSFSIQTPKNCLEFYPQFKIVALVSISFFCKFQYWYQLTFSGKLFQPVAKFVFLSCIVYSSGYTFIDLVGFLAGWLLVVRQYSTQRSLMIVTFKFSGGSLFWARKNGKQRLLVNQFLCYSESNYRPLIRWQLGLWLYFFLREKLLFLRRACCFVCLIHPGCISWAK